MLMTTFPDDRAAQHHALEHLHQRHPERRHFQRAHYHRAYPARAARRRLQTDGRARHLATQPADLRLRRSHRSVYRNQADRPYHHRASPGLTNETILLPYSRRSRIDACPGSSLLRSLSAHRLRNFAAVISRQGERQFDYRCRRERPRLEVVGPGVSDPKYFHPRPSAAGNGYDATSSGGSNLGPTSQKLDNAIKERIAAYRAENGLSGTEPVPADAVTASGSGLDPEISLRNAELQLARVAKARGLSEDKVRELVQQNTDGRDLGVFGDPGVNVLQLNLALDQQH